MRYDGSVPVLVRILTVALCAGGAVGAITSFLLIKGGWPWPMPDLAYRFLAGAAVAYAVGSAIVLTRRGWAESEILLATVVLYGVPLGAAILIEPGPVDWSKPVAWSFVGLVVPALLISGGALWVNRRVLAGEPPDPLPSALRGLLGVIAVAGGVVGLLVYAVPREAGFVWPWAELGPWKALDSRLLASMLLTISGAAALVAWRNRQAMADVFLPMLWGYCVVSGAGLVIHAVNTPAMRTEDLIYVAIFTLIAASTLYLYVPQRLSGHRQQPV